jgi:hypothetical protein
MTPPEIHIVGFSEILSETEERRKYILSLFILPDLETNSGAGGATAWFRFLVLSRVQVEVIGDSSVASR